MPEAAVISQVGPYTVERELGRGGMGVVYLATDTRLGRSVAIKAIAPAFVNDGERLARFEREARALAALHHPNIAGIYGIEEAGGQRYLVLEYVEGRTLAERLSAAPASKGGAASRAGSAAGPVGGPMPVDEALEVCVQIASGLEAAHEAGIVHRDLKPSNVKITPDGRVKILDFGLAREDEVRAGSTADLLSSPTVSHPGARSAVTGLGMVVGTAGYMSPEQARGKPLDKRTDIWAFGCVLYECLAGRMVFGGETNSDAIAAILERQPEWDRLPARTPPRVRELLKHCLEKDARQRLRDIGDARIELERSIAGREWTSTGAMAAATGRVAGVGGGRAVRAAAWAAPVLLAAVAVLGYMLWRGSATSRGAATTPAEPPRVNRLSLDLTIGEGERYIGGFASADGRYFEYITSRLSDGSGRSNRLWLRAIDSFEARAVEGGDGAIAASFSPDGRWIAFTRTGATMPVRKAPVAGGPAVTICEHTPSALGNLTWADDRTLVICGADLSKTMWVLSAEGGDLRQLKLNGLPEDVVGLEIVRAVPPGGRSVLLSAGMESGEKGYHDAMFGVDLESGLVRPLVEVGAGGRVVEWAGGSLLVFSRVDSLLGQRFDPGTVSVTGPITPLISGLRTSTANSAWQWSIARDGTLFYRSGGVQGRERRLALVKSDGQVQTLGTVRAAFTRGVTPSPDGAMIACVIARENQLFTIGVYDVAADRMTVLPVGEIDADEGVLWSRDGRSVFFPALAKGRGVAVYQVAADGSAPARVVHQCGIPNGWVVPGLWADAAGEWLVASEVDTGTLKANWVLVSVADGKAKPLAAGMDYAPFPGAASPDGKWMVCGAVDAGKPGTAIFPVPMPGQAYEAKIRRRFSEDGYAPAWSSDGKAIFYGKGDAIMTIELKAGEAEPTPAGPPKQLISLAKTPTLGRAMIMPGTRDAVGVPDSLDDVGVVRIDVIQNWLSEVRGKLPAAGRAGNTN